MKFLFFIPSLRSGGAERVAVILATEFINRGHEVTIVVESDVCQYNLTDEIKTICINNRSKDDEANSFVVRLVTHIGYLWRQYKEVKKILKQESPTIVISFISYASLPLVLLCRKKIPLIFSEHTTFNRSSITKSLKYNRKYLLKYGDVVTILTNYDKGFVNKRLKNAVVMPNPLSFEPLSNEVFDNTFDARRDILACGTLYDIKGFDSLIKAFSLISNKYPEVLLDIVGSGDKSYYDYLNKLINELGLSRQVNMLGYCSNIREIMQKHSVFVLSSKQEGLPMSLMEAMSCGCACLSYDCVTGPSEIIVDTIDGLLARDQDIKDLSDKMDVLLSDKDLRYKLGKHAIDNISRFDKNVIVDRWLYIFDKLKEKYCF